MRDDRASATRDHMRHRRARQNERAVEGDRQDLPPLGQPHFQEALPDAICFASIVRLSTKQDLGRDGRDRLLFVSPDNLVRADGKDS